MNASTLPSPRVIAFFLGLALALTALQAVRNPPMNPDAECCDHLFYRSMAYNFFDVTRPNLNSPPPDSRLFDAAAQPYYAQWSKPEDWLNRQPPFVYRPLTPLLARTIGGLVGDNINLGFYFVSFVSLVLSCFLLALIIYALSSNMVLTVAAAVTFSQIVPVFAQNLWDFMLTDGAAFLFMLLGIYLLIIRRERLFLLVTFVGMLNKETVLLLLPCYLLKMILERRLNVGRVAGVAVIFAIYFLFRVSIPIPNNSYTLANTFVGIPTPEFVARGMFGIFGVLVIAAIFRFGRNEVNIWLMPLALGAIASEMFTHFDAERTYVVALPLIFAATFGLKLDSLALVIAALVTPALFLLERLTEAYALPVNWAFVLAALVAEVLFFALVSRTKPSAEYGLARLIETKISQGMTPK